MNAKNFGTGLIVILFVNLLTSLVFGESDSSVANTTLDIETCPTITISPPTLPDGTRGIPYFVTITASGGTPPYTFAVVLEALPPGLTLNPNTGVISGIPTAAGDFLFIIEATDANGCFGGRLYTINIAQCPIITLSPQSLPDGTVGTDYNATITASGGSAPYTFAVTTGSLPTGLSLDSNSGVISGTPTNPGTFNFKITATDAIGCSGSRNYSINISDCPIIILSPPALPDGTVGVAYNATITASGGTAPYSFAVTVGSLPTGLILDPNSGIISGTPTTIGTFNFSVTASDASGCSGSQVYSIDIVPIPCTYEDRFDDGLLSWTVVKPNVAEIGGFLVLSPAGKKAVATSPATFAGCAICTLTAEISLDGGIGQKAWIFTHRIDKNNQIEILIDEEQDKIIVKQKVAGSVVRKAKANFTILPSTLYSVALNYDGTTITLTIDGANVLSFLPVGVVPSGIMGFQDKNGVLFVNQVCVN